MGKGRKTMLEMRSGWFDEDNMVYERSEDMKVI